MVKRDYERILDGLKIASRLIKVIRDENNPENRKSACSLAEDMLNHVFRDVKEVYETTHPQNDTTSFTGTIDGAS